MPALEALQGRLLAANTQPLGISVDSIYCHANWAKSLGGISFPLLADFHPKGAMARDYGVYLEDKGITDRATVIVDANGIVRYLVSVTPAGERDMSQLAGECEGINNAYQGNLDTPKPPPGIEEGCRLFVRNNCGFSRAVLLARDNLHLGERLPVSNLSEDTAALQLLRKLTAQEQAPCLLIGDKPVLDSKVIIDYSVGRVAAF